MRDERAKQGKLFENDSGGNAMDALQPSTLTHFFRILNILTVDLFAVGL